MAALIMPAIAWRNPWVFIPSSALGYLLLIRLLRFRRRDGWLRYFKHKYGSTDRQALAKLTLDDAWRILKELLEQEFPTTFSTSVFFALFKTYGVPTISATLTHTSQLSSPATASKRTTDTAALITEFVINPPPSERRLAGIARMNYLHQPYRKAGRISHADMLYTLSLFALEPWRWVEREGWRAMTDLERAALGTFWKDLGEAMGIPYGALEPHCGAGPGETREGGLAWFEAIDRWSRKYERECMVPADSNVKMSHATLDILTFNTPSFAKGFVRQLIYTLMEPRLRASMRIADPSWTAETLSSTLLTLRILATRYLLPPRPHLLRRRLIEDHPDAKTGKYFLVDYVSHPYYVRPTLWKRWSPAAFMTRYVWGGVLPGDEGNKYRPGGYEIAELGPERQRGRGRVEMEGMKEVLRGRYSEGGGKCPMGYA